MNGHGSVTAGRASDSSRTRAFLLIGLWAVVPGARPAAALDPQKQVTQYGHRAWRTQEGLPQNSVEAALQTRDGYLWLATLEGLVRFDGVRFTVFDSANTEGLEGNHVRALLEDREGSLWIGTYGAGLTRLQGERFTHYSAADGLGSDFITALFQDSRGRLWIGGAGAITVFEAGRFSAFPAAAVRTTVDVHGFAEDRAGALWIATDAGVLRLKEGELETFTTRDGLKDDRVLALLEDRAGQVWVGTSPGGLHRFSGGRFVSHPLSARVADDRIRTLLQDRDGNLWVGTFGGGLVRLREGKAAVYTKAQGLSVDFVLCLYEDREGALWIGTNGGGLNQLWDTTFTVYATREGLSEDVVSALFEDSAGVVWIGTQGGGLNRLEGGGVTAYRKKDGLSSDQVVSVFKDRAGTLWVGTAGAGLNRLEGDAFRVLTTRDGLASNYIRAIRDDSRGNLWVGTEDGLSRFKDGRFVNYGTRDGLPNSYVISIHEDRHGSLWFGTHGGGLIRFRDGVFTPYRFATEPASQVNVVRSIYEDGPGDLWLGTNGGGLVRLKDGAFTRYTVKEGLFDDVVHQVFEDDHGYLWMSSNKGVSRVLKRELIDLAEGRLRRVHVSSYGTADGMRNPECNGGSQPTAFRSRDGKMWFSTMEGAVVIDPSRLAASPPPPPAAIEEVIVDGARISGRQPAEALPGARNLEFHYTALGLLAPTKAHFRYQLDGFDRDWVEAGSRRTAYYTNVPPGRYVFRVAARSGDGAWNEAGASVPFRLRPYFYQQTWFLVAVALLAVVGCLGLIRLRTRRLRQQADELQRGIREALASIKVLQGLLPMCAWCKRIRDDRGYWSDVEAYIQTHTHADFTHGICPDCVHKLRDADRNHEGLHSRS